MSPVPGDSEAWHAPNVRAQYAVHPCAVATITAVDGSRVSARYFVTEIGCLLEPYVPDFEGVDTFGATRTTTFGWEKPRDLVSVCNSTGVGVVRRTGKHGRSSSRNDVYRRRQQRPRNQCRD